MKVTFNDLEKQPTNTLYTMTDWTKEEKRVKIKSIRCPQRNTRVDILTA